MMKIFLNDSDVKESLYPFGVVKPVSSIRIGILTIREKWETITGEEILDHTTGNINEAELVINANIVPTLEWWNKTKTDLTKIDLSDNTIVKAIEFPWQIFQWNDWAARKDFELLTKNKKSQPLSSTNKTIASENIFIEEGAKVEHSIINASTGPVYIGKNAEVMEGCFIRGPFSLGENAVLKMGAKVYGATTLGPFCMGGGEIKNAVLMGYSNKAHDGYLGDSVIGEWCNLGAGTSNSNIKNTAGTVQLWDNRTKSYLPAGLKAGLIMGDYSRAAINTSFNTGTMVGICCNVFGHGFPPKYIPDFTWGTEKYTFAKILNDIDNWKKLKNQSITEKEKEILKTLYNQ